jgi:trans-2,3-dihydro-3-hydroxyanthranilate isomerase
MAEFRYMICDVFTDRPLEGNPLAVFTDARGIPEALLQPLAREMHLSETVFCYPARGNGHVRMRIFTPRHELPFAGHPVLGTAFVLAAPLQLPEIVLETGVGPVPVRLERDGPRIVFGRMVQPVPRIEAVQDPAALLRALGVARATLPVELYDTGPRHVFVALGDESEVAALQPDFQALAHVYPRVTTNCFAGAGRRWKTRAFAPGGGTQGPGHGLRRRATRLPPGALRPDPLRGGDRDPSGRRDSPAERPLRPRRRRPGPDRAGRGRRVGRHGGARRVSTAQLSPSREARGAGSFKTCSISPNER